MDTKEGIIKDIYKEGKVLNNDHKEYQNLQGVERRVEKVKSLIKAMWVGVEVFSILPYQHNNIKMTKQGREIINTPTEEKKRDLLTM